MRRNALNNWLITHSKHLTNHDLLLFLSKNSSLEVTHREDVEDRNVQALYIEYIFRHGLALKKTGIGLLIMKPLQEDHDNLGCWNIARVKKIFYSLPH